MFLLALPSVLAATAAGAMAIPTGERAAPSDLDARPRVRSGIVLGLSLGGDLGSASGYPNSSAQIGNPTDYSASGFMLGTSATLLIMGAISDYVNFGFWFGNATFKSADWRSTGGGGGLRVEIFPLVALLPRFSGLGVIGQFGLGSGELSSTIPGRPEASGTQSFIGTGAFYEWSFGRVLGGHFGVGPSLEYDAMWSLPFERHGLEASARIVFYGGP